MNILKNAEAVFISTAAIACTSAFLFSPAPMPKADAPIYDAGTPMQVVVVSAKRMTPDEKLQSMREERQLAASRDSVAKRG
jgi:hypothetical protein